MTFYKPDLASLLTRPGFFLYNLDLQRGVFEFVRTTRDDLSDYGFLDYRTLGRIQKKHAEPGQTVFEAAQRTDFWQAPPRLNHLFHTGYCCSTMIARCLDVPGKNLSLKEPMALIGLAAFKRSAPNFSPQDPNWVALRDLALGMLSKPFEDGETTLLKPTNSVNLLIEDLMASRFSRNTLLVYGGLERFLISVIGGGSMRAQLIEDMVKIITMDSPNDLPVPAGDVARFTLLQKAAMVWGAQVAQFGRILETHPKNRIRSLDCEAFLENPAETTKRISAFLDLGLAESDIAQNLQGPAFRAHSKDQNIPFGRQRQDQERQAILAREGEAVKETLGFAEKLGIDPSPALKNAV